ncbi:MAG: radical SAM protein [Phycisphaerales bacterium]|nr:radical SAM protein [Phycisphaerales bacterium]
MPIYSPPPQHPALSAADPGLLEAVALGAARLTPEQGLQLLTSAPLHSLGRWADARCRALHGDALRTYVIDRNINYTNVCSAKCTFCAFRRDAGDHDAYTLSEHAIHEKIAQLVAIGGTQILMQGGMNPDLPLEWYLDLLAGIKRRFPGVHIHAFSPPEFIEFVHFFDPPGDTLEDKIRWVMVRLRDAGLDSVPGGGGEIFAPAVRRKIGLGKCDADAWLTVMYVAHTLGMFTSATMMFGHIEGYADRMHHLHLVRQWQDRALTAPQSGAPTGHYVSFITWPFQRENTPLGRVKDWGARPEDLAPGSAFPGDVVATLDGTGLDGSGDPRSHPDFGRRVRMAGATAYLRTQAVARLFLDNIYSMGASWVTMGPHIGQVALAYGASDMGSVMMEENVVSSAGTTYCLDEAVLCRLIRGAGFTPAQRNNTYDIIRAHPADRGPHGVGAPDLAVSDWSTHRARRLHIQTSAAAERAPAASVAPAALVQVGIDADSAPKARSPRA